MKRGSLVFLIGLVILLSLGLVVAIPNPAPIYCEEMGYVSNGTHCIFDDNNSCEEWAFYNGECGSEYVKELACIEEGGSLLPGHDCCEGLITINPKGAPINDEGICDQIVGSFGICAPCGNGVCDEEFEDECNCPEDCIDTSNGDDGDDSNETDDNDTDDSGCEWSCTRWSVLCVDGKRTRECTNVNNCSGDPPKTELRCRVRAESGNKTSQGIGQELRERIRERKEELRAGNYTGPQGQLLGVREIVRGLKELRVRNAVAKTKLNVTIETDEENQTKITVQLKNGREIEIKVMPDRASERALARLRLKVCSEANNCTLELKEVGQGENMRASYEVQVERHSRILGIFKKKMKVSSEVDAETGDVVYVKKPWWAFLAAEPEEE